MTRVLVGVTALFTALVVHEAGHAVAGWLAGFRFELLGAGPIALARSEPRFRLQGLPPHLWGPFAVAYPMRLQRLSSRLAWYAAAGPLASAALAAAAWRAASLASTPSGRNVAVMIAVASACVFAATAQPFGTGAGVPTDGRRVWEAIRPQPAADSAAALPGNARERPELTRQPTLAAWIPCCFASSPTPPSFSIWPS